MYYIHNHNPVNIEWKLTGQLESFCFPNPRGPRRAEHHLLPPPTEAEPDPSGRNQARVRVVRGMEGW